VGIDWRKEVAEIIMSNIFAAFPASVDAAVRYAISLTGAGVVATDIT